MTVISCKIALACVKPGCSLLILGSPAQAVGPTQASVSGLANHEATMPTSSARLRAWADVVRQRAGTLDNPDEAAQLLELARSLDELVIWRRTQRGRDL